MKLRDALQKSGWENFKNSQNEEWNVTDLLNEVLPGDSENWLDTECTVSGDVIIDSQDDELTEA
jgi:hypothetical protein